ncbi:MAG: DUF167 domain-containing protein [Rhodospirillales bacterium]|nr:DUF167 domain-containing protein [Rhodospirillales bacterium]
MATAEPTPLVAVADGVFLSVRVTPRSRRPGVGGVIGDGALAVAVSAPPENGRAIDATVEMLAEHFGLPKRAFVLTQGAGARHKRFKIEGEPADLYVAMKARLP